MEGGCCGLVEHLPVLLRVRGTGTYQNQEPHCLSPYDAFLRILMMVNMLRNTVLNTTDGPSQPTGFLKFILGARNTIVTRSKISYLQ